ncbi:MAG: hypothetical protein F4013_12160 [Gammaproteobacteria bacterium]|nr:hypothetical protein [Gammaproteobacteria bacterium]
MPMLPPERDRMLEGMPTSSPRMFTSAPPELPGLIDASVWMKSSMGLGAASLRTRGMDLPRALTMPEVTVWVSPKGLPMATTKSPTCTASESPSGIWVRSSASSSSSTATSVPASDPTTTAETDRPSLRVTSISDAFWIT